MSRGALIVVAMLVLGPAGRAAAEPDARHALVVEGDRIRLGGALVARVPPWPSCPEASALAPALERWARSELATSNPRGLRVVVTGQTSYRVLCSVLRTARAARVPIAAVVVRGQKEASIPVVRGGDSPLRLAVVIRASGFQVSGAGGELPLLPCAEPPRACRGGEYPHAKLGALLDGIKRRFPDERTITLAAEDAVPVSVLASTVGTARGQPEPVKCLLLFGCRFDRIALESLEEVRLARKQAALAARREAARSTTMAPAPERVPKPIVKPGGDPTGERALAERQRAITSRIQGDGKALRGCYGRSTASATAAVTRIGLQAEVDRHGRVTRTTVVLDTASDPALLRCLAGRVKAWRLPPAEAPYSIGLPLTFVPAAR